MEENQEEPNKHVCKLCSTSFFSGKALGGHMRCHGTENSSGTDENLKDFQMGTESNCVYGLRENPKKSWKFSDSKKGRISKQENPCKICGKGFHSSRALSGHMRTHSRRGEGNICRECGKGFFSSRALFGHMRCHSERIRASAEGQSDTETSGPIRRKRSNRARYKITAKPHAFPVLYSSSSVSEVETERELEEGAICLMMLSRGIRDWTNFNLPLANEQIAENEGKNFVSNGDGTLLRKEGSEFGGLDSGSASSMKMEVGLEAPETGFLKNDDHPDEFKNPKMDAKPGNIVCGAMKMKAELDEGLTSKLKAEVADSELGHSYELFDNQQEGGKYSCKTCHKCFHSHQALGGHRASSRNSCFPLKPHSCEKTELEGNESSSEKEVGEMNVSGHELKKGSKGHECSVCFKVFKSGQALGGHKRAHFSDTNVQQQPLVAGQEHSDVTDALDLNFPVDFEGDEGNDCVGLRPWWVENSREHEPRLGLIPS